MLFEIFIFELKREFYYKKQEVGNRCYNYNLQGHVKAKIL